jgi:hypothetical protein
VLATGNGGLLGKVPAGRPPQHIAFIPSASPHAFITSGYGSSIEMVNPATRKVIRTEGLPYGSFNLATSGGLVVTCSLLNGEVTEFNGRPRNAVAGDPDIQPESRTHTRTSRPHDHGVPQGARIASRRNRSLADLA